jgi:hypothetical protein
VVWSHAFTDDREVAAFRWTSAFGGGNDPLDSPQPNQCKRITTDPLFPNGCLELRRKTTSAGPCWWRPLSPMTYSGLVAGLPDDPGAGVAKRAWSPTSGGSQTAGWQYGNYAHADYAAIGASKDGNDFWLQFRMKVDPVRQTTGSSGKVFYISRTERSLTAQEINSEISQSTRKFDLYTGGSPTLHGTATGNKPNPVMAAGEYDNLYGAAGTTPPQWSWPYGVWDTFLIHVIPGHENDNYSGSNLDTGIEVWAAHEGETSYTKIWSRSNYLFDFQNDLGYSNGWNALIFHTYTDPLPDQEFYVRYAQVIFKKGTGSAFGSDPEVHGIRCPTV